MLKATICYTAGGAALIGGPALGYDLMRRGRLASAEHLHHQQNAAYRRALQDGISTNYVCLEAERAGLDPTAVRRHLDQLRDVAGTPALDHGQDAD